MVRKGEMMDVEDIVDLLSIDLIGVVPDDEYIITQTNKGEPVIQNKKAPSGKAYMEIAKRVLGEKIEVTIPVKGSIIRSEQTSNDMYVSIDLVEEIIERQLKKYKSKIIAQHQSGGNFQQEFMDKEYMEEEEVKIAKVKHFDIKPMYPEDACVQMELLGHSFYVFCNAETDEVNVVYKRKGGTYGIIEPER